MFPSAVSYAIVFIFKMTENSGDEEQEVLVYMDFNTKMDDDYFSSDKEFKIIGLEEEKPILQLGNQVFQGEWQDAMGTNLFFQESRTTPTYDPTFSEPPELNMRYSCKTDKILHMSRVFLNPKTSNTDNHGSDSNTEGNDNDSLGQEIE